MKEGKPNCKEHTCKSPESWERKPTSTLGDAQDQVKSSKKQCNPHKMFIVHTNKIVDVFTVQNHLMSKHIKTAKDEDKRSS